MNLVPLSSTNCPPSDLEAREIRRLIQEGDAHIAEVDVEIQRTVAALEVLRDRRDVYHQEVDALHAIISPIRRFPPEILSEVFLAGLKEAILSASYPSSHPSQPPILFGRVCSGWRRVALNTPKLWADIQLELTKPVRSGTISLITDFVRRSRPLPLSIEISLSSTRYLGTPLTILWPFCDRVQALALITPKTYLQLFVGVPGTMFPNLRSLDITIPNGSRVSTPAFVGELDAFEVAPNLTSLGIEADRTPDILDLFADGRFPWSQLRNLHLVLSHNLFQARWILSQCAQLETFFLNLSRGFDSAIDIPSCVLPKLQALTYGMAHDDHSSVFFEPFAFPQLRELNIDAFVVSQDTLLGLVDRSGFELQKLTIRHLELAGEELVPFLRKIPSLKQICLDNSMAIGRDFFTALKYLGPQDSITLPTLEDLTILTEECPDADILVEMLESRWWPDPAGALNAPPISRLKRVVLDADLFDEMDQGLRTRLNVLMVAGVLHLN
ncbi:hypothetical protein B0H11DRAFT_1882929 [Mycena galericulata]|nr:hypothetical protein B0H11DRAFT_1882929 [Mycena galericulata]